MNLFPFVPRSHTEITNESTVYRIASKFGGLADCPSNSQIKIHQNFLRLQNSILPTHVYTLQYYVLCT